MSNRLIFLGQTCIWRHIYPQQPVTVGSNPDLLVICIFTTTSAQVGWMPTVEDKLSYVRPHLENNTNNKRSEGQYLPPSMAHFRISSSDEKVIPTLLSRIKRTSQNFSQNFSPIWVRMHGRRIKNFGRLIRGSSIGFSGPGISHISSSEFGIWKQNRGEFWDWKYARKWDSKYNPRDYGIARNFESGLRDWRTLLGAL